MRLGTILMTPSGPIANGVIQLPAHRDYLTEQGYKLERCEGIPEPKMTAQEQEEAAAADRFLGRDRDGHAGAVARDIKKGMDQLLAPLRKKTYRDQLR
jgi:hypothetical protein